MTQNLQVLAQQQADIFNLFSNSRRLLILWLLEEKELSVGDIADSIGATLQNTSQHLRILKDNNLVEARRDGKTVYYRTSPASHKKYAFLYEH